METVVNYLMMFADQCAQCKEGRKGLCAWMKNYRSESAKYNVQEKDTFEQRATACFAGAGEPCDDQMSFDEFVSCVDIYLTNAMIPTSYRSLVETLSLLAQLSKRSSRFSRQLLPLLADFLGTGIEHCLAHIDYTYLNWGFDIEALLFAFFPAYQRMVLLTNCNYPLVVVQRAVSHSTALSIGDMEVLNILMPDHSEDFGIGIPNSSTCDSSMQEPTGKETLPDSQMQKITPFLTVLVEKGYCRPDYHWISTREDGGHAYTQAAWIIQRLSRMFPDIRQYKLGLLMGIKNINSYSSRIEEDSPFKVPILDMFEKAGHKLK